MVRMEIIYMFIMSRKAEIEMEHREDRKKDRQTDRQTDRHRDKETNNRLITYHLLIVNKLTHTL